MVPSIVIAPGAWHAEPHYSKLIAALGARGLATDMVPYPTWNSTVGSVDADAAAYAELVTALVEGGREVVIVGHSSGGQIAGVSAAGLGKVSRAKQGKSGGVIGILMIAAFVVNEGASLDAVMGGKPAPFLTSTVSRTWTFCQS